MIREKRHNGRLLRSEGMVIRKALIIMSLLAMATSMYFWVTTALQWDRGVGLSFPDDFQVFMGGGGWYVGIDLGCAHVFWVNSASQAAGVRINAMWVPFYERSPGYLFNLGLPLWLFVIFFGALSWLAYRPIGLRKWRARSGLCLSCGYNLKGLTRPRCPECGAPFPKELT